jgi:hypothetical protein
MARERRASQKKLSETPRESTSTKIRQALRRFPLSATQWRDIQNAGRLPDEARHDIETSLRGYAVLRASVADRLHAGRTRWKLKQVERHAQSLLLALVGDESKVREVLRDYRASHDRRVLFLPGHYSHEFLEIKKALLNYVFLGDDLEPLGLVIKGGGTITSEEVARRIRDNALPMLFDSILAAELLRRWTAAAASWLPADPRGAHKTAEANKRLVCWLNEILSRYTGRHVSRSYKSEAEQRFVELCFKAAHPQIGDGSIKKAVQAHVYQQRRVTK